MTSPKPAHVSIRDGARRLIRGGFRPVPIVRGAKSPNIENWVSFRCAEDEVDRHFPEDGNLGLILTGGVVDVDLDCAEAVRLAPAFLPPQAIRFGRASKPASHWLYTVTGDTPRRLTFEDGQMLVELRGEGHQTMIPPSMHPSGEAVTWVDETDRMQPLEIAVLDRAVRLLAVATLLRRRWPEQGTRNETALATAGFLLDSGCTPEEAAKVIGEVAKDVGTQAWRERAEAVGQTLRAREHGQATTGGPRLTQLLQGDGEAAVRRLRRWLGVNVEAEEVLEKMNAEYFVATVGSDGGTKRVVVCEEKAGRFAGIYPTHEFVKKFPQTVRVGKRSLKCGAWWLDQERRRTYSSLEFAPPPAECPTDAYNLWTGFACQPSGSEPQCARLLAHLRDVWCGGRDDLNEYLLNWFARLAQRPGEAGEVALVLRGGKGAGKSMPVREIGKAWFGRAHFGHLSDERHLTGNFNAQLSGKCLVFADEAIWAGDKSGERTLKRLITEPTLTIERKGVDLIEERNCVHLIMAGNDTWVAPFGPRERRFFVLDVSDARQRDYAYFEALAAEFECGGAAAFLAVCLARDISGFNVRSVPMTDAAREQQDLSLGPVEAWWLEKLLDGRLLPVHETWEIDTGRDALYQDFQAQSRGRVPGPIAWRETLQRLLPDYELGRQEPKKCWPRRRQRRIGDDRDWVVVWPTLRECRAAWDTATGAPREWPEDAGEKKPF